VDYNLHQPLHSFHLPIGIFLFYYQYPTFQQDTMDL
jgi:hypothetical protein